MKTHWFFFPPLFSRPTGRPAFPQGAALALAGWLVVSSASPVLAGRVAAAGAGHGFSGSPSPTAPHLNSPSSGQLTNSDVSQLNTQSQLNRLSNASALSYDIVPPTPPTPLRHTPLPGYQVVRLGRAHNNRLCLAGTVAGTKGLMMLDTGANNTVLGDTIYRSLLLNASYALPSGVPRSITLNGVTTPLAEAPNFYVGESNLGSLPVCLIPGHYLDDPTRVSEGSGRSYDGLIGENILRHYNAMIDCSRLVLYLDIDPARKLNLSSAFARHGWTRVPMSDAGRDFTVPCTLNGHNYRLIVDTGSPFTSLDRTLLSSAGVASRDLPYRAGLIGTDALPVGLVELGQLQIGGYTLTDVHMIATAQSLAGFDRHNDASIPIVGLLGGDLLAKNGAIIDIGNKALYLKRTSTESSAPRSKPAERRRAEVD